MLGSLLNQLPTFHWLLEINLSLSAYYFIAHLLSVVALCIVAKTLQRRRVLLGIIASLVLASAYVPQLYPFYAKRAPAATAQRVRVLYTNLYIENDTPAEFGKVIAEEKPAIIGIVEFSSRLEKGLALPSEYRFRAVHNNDSSFGVAFFSRYPLSEITYGIGIEAPSVLMAKVTLPNSVPVRLAILHAPPPVGAELFYLRNMTTRRVSSFLRERDENMIVMGDLNATPFSKPYRQFTRESNFRDALHGFGLLRTWSAFNPLARMTIDHIFYRGKLKVIDFRRLDAVGSDHFPVVVDFGL